MHIKPCLLKLRTWVWSILVRTQGISTEGIQISIDEVEQQLMGAVSNYSKITAEELIAYFDGPAPSGDTTTLNDILNNRWLLTHEIIELSELKNMGFNISIKFLHSQTLEVDLAHIIAIDRNCNFPTIMVIRNG